MARQHQAHFTECPPRTGAFWGGPSHGAEAAYGGFRIYKNGRESYSLVKAVVGGWQKLGVHKTIFKAKVAASKACRPSARAKRRR